MYIKDIVEPEILKKLEELEKKVEQMRKYFLWTLIITAVVIILPIIVMLFIIPSFLSSYDPASLGL